MINALANQGMPGSEITLAIWNKTGSEEVKAVIRHGKAKGNATHISPTGLEGLHQVVNLFKNNEYDNVVILCDKAYSTSDDPDTDVLLAQYLVHKALASSGREGLTRVAVELMSENDVSITKAIGHNGDFIVAEHLVSQLIAQLLENPKRAVIFNELFDLKRYIVGLKPIEKFVYKDEEFRFEDVYKSLLR